MILAAPDAAWPDVAAAEIARWTGSVPGLLDVHHIGSTAVPALVAKPVIDLLPVFGSRDAMAAARDSAGALGYDCLGEYGLPGRCYFRRDDPASGCRLVHAHAYVADHPGVARHLAFRNLLRADGALRDAYAAEKARCARLHPGGGSGYGDCKSGWIATAEARALREGWDRR